MLLLLVYLTHHQLSALIHILIFKKQFEILHEKIVLRLLVLRLGFREIIFLFMIHGTLLGSTTS